MLKRRGGRGRRSQECQYGRGGGDKTGSSTASGGPSVVPHPAQPAELGAVRGGGGEEGGIKPVAQLPVVVPSVVPHPAQPAALGAVRGQGKKKTQ